MAGSDRDLALQLCPILDRIGPELEIYQALLLKWQRRINLIGASTSGHIWTRHFADSAQLIEYADAAARWADLGSGAGFPGLIIALLQKPFGGEMHLIESDTRKAAFLREVSRETSAKAIIHNARCEDVLPELRPSVLTSRALANLSHLVSLSADSLSYGASAVFLKGRDVDGELHNSSLNDRYCVRVVPSKIDSSGCIVQINAKTADGASPGRP